MLQWTDRERVILAALCQGKSNKEIANACRVSVATVKNYLKALMRKTGAHNRTQVALVGNGNGHAEVIITRGGLEQWLLLKRTINTVQQIIDEEISRLQMNE